VYFCQQTVFYYKAWENFCASSCRPSLKEPASLKFLTYPQKYFCILVYLESFICVTGLSVLVNSWHVWYGDCNLVLNAAKWHIGSGWLFCQ